jgi:hypothetical protein
MNWSDRWLYGEYENVEVVDDVAVRGESRRNCEQTMAEQQEDDGGGVDRKVNIREMRGRNRNGGGKCKN